MRVGPALAITFAALLAAACARQPPADVVYRATGAVTRPAPASSSSRMA